MQDHLRDLNIGGRPMTDKELAEHYKHLYGTIKKQKDDVTTYIKNNFIEGEVFYSKTWLKKKKEDLLRLLGEIDE